MKEGLEKDLPKKENSMTKENRDPLTDNGKKKGKEEKPATKVVVRRLPPSMTQEQFIQQISPLPETDYMYFVQADMSLFPHCFSRAYINFVNQEDLFIFTQKFDNYVFVDSKGQEYPAVVEFAPFQRVPKHRPNRKKDPKMGTVELDPVFISFKEKLEAEMLENKSAANAVKQHFFETSAVITEKKEITTPLLDFIRNRRVERQRIRDEKREEKRKKELERRRAKDEQRKTKKEDDSPVVKPQADESILPNQSVPVIADIKPGSETDIKKPLSCDPNLPKGTPFYISSLEKCLLEFQKNITATQLNKIKKNYVDEKEIKFSTVIDLPAKKQEQKIEQDCVNFKPDKDALLEELYRENIGIETFECISSCIGSSDNLTTINTKVDNKQLLTKISVLKNPLNDGLRNGQLENVKINDLKESQVQIMKPLHRFTQKGAEKTPFVIIAENEKMYSNNLCTNLNKIVENVFKNTPTTNNIDVKNKDLKIFDTKANTKHQVFQCKKNEFQKASKVVRLLPPRPLRSLSSKSLSSFTLNEKSLEPCITNIKHVREFPRHTSKIFFPISKKAKA